MIKKILWTYPRPLQPGLFIKRYKRFFVDVERPDGTIETIHCANSGSMQSCLQDRCNVLTLDSENPMRKLRHSLELMSFEEGYACLNTARSNQIAESFLEKSISFANGLNSEFFATTESAQCQLIETDFKGFHNLKREVTYNSKTRLDFLCNSQDQKCWIEVKSVTLRLPSGELAFPDAKTERGQKHIQDLIEAVQLGNRGILLFVCMRSSYVSEHEIASRFRIAAHIDPVYFQLIQLAVSAGVQIRILVPDMSASGFEFRGYFKFLNT